MGPVPQSPFTGQFFTMTTFGIAFYESYLATMGTVDVKIVLLTINYT